MARSVPAIKVDRLNATPPRLSTAATSDREQYGYTLVEIVVTLAILVILMALLIPSIRGARRTAIEARCASDVRTLHRACYEYALANKNSYPDLSLKGGTTSTYSSQVYWSWPNWRVFMEDYFGLSRVHWYSPSNPKWMDRDDFYYWGWDGSDPSTATHFVTGRFYFSSTVANGDGMYNGFLPAHKPPVGERPLFAQRITQRSHFKFMWTDLNRQYPAGPADDWISPGDPLRHGSNHLYDDRGYWPVGSHVGLLDGSVQWTVGSEIEHRVTKGGAELFW